MRTSSSRLLWAPGAAELLEGRGWAHGHTAAALPLRGLPRRGVCGPGHLWSLPHGDECAARLRSLAHFLLLRRQQQQVAGGRGGVTSSSHRPRYQTAGLEVCLGGGSNTVHHTRAPSQPAGAVHPGHRGLEGGSRSLRTVLRRVMHTVRRGSSGLHSLLQGPGSGSH
ncbi:hypothetical protein NDU88_004663 [Pleurodeles waltl]|uniref:Uncharacterized protein n=1 Tax=Pleurodeles waltl TaxID=8319 RepID=A0AAV7PDR0_PLEWA|nr:hypothetical protein NDU88_004663 [Pleurodeles waltl]